MVYDPSSSSDEMIDNEVIAAGCKKLLDTNVWNDRKHEFDHHKKQLEND